jgi:hypothetical protein
MNPTPYPPELDIDALLDGINTAVKAKFLTLKTVDDYLRVQEQIAVPAVVLDIVGIEPDGNGDAGTEQFAAVITLAAYCVVTFKQENGQKAKRNAATLAGAVAAFVKEQTWGCPVQLAEKISCTPDVWPSKSQAYECWRVEWQHSCFLGTSIWTEGGAGVTQVNVEGGPHECSAHR